MPVYVLFHELAGLLESILYTRTGAEFGVSPNLIILKQCSMILGGGLSVAGSFIVEQRGGRKGFSF